ncbi:MAG TPA: sulfur carrier protein ThiS adenylyltransferase ThiF, partial [Polyangiaceae bacterium]
GVKNLTLVDFDRVEESNLNRQLFFRDQVGMLKTEALAVTLRRIGPELELDMAPIRVTADNLVELVRGADVVVEAVDQPDVKAMIVDVVTRDLPDVPLVVASGLAGYAKANNVRTERLADNVWVVGDMTSDVREGHALLASRVMVAAAHEAHAAVRLLLGCDPD